MIRYYWNLIKCIASISTSSMLVYRSNVIFFFLFETFFTIANLGGLALGVNLAGGHLAGWSFNEVMFVASLFGVGHQIFLTTCLSGLFHTGFFVWSGRMDYVLLKPLHPLVGMHAATEFVISNIPNILINIFLFGLFLIRTMAEGKSFSLLNSLGLIVFFMAGLAVRYGIAILVVAPSFFAEKLAEGEDAFWSLQSLGKYPVGVFPRSMQMILTFLLPIASIAAIPAAVFFGRENLHEAFVHLISSVAFVIITVKFYEFGTRRYKSVNTGA